MFKTVLCPQPISATEDAPGLITITYDTNIKIGGPVGFAVRMKKILFVRQQILNC
jgi:hypothetical protein